MEKPDDGPRWPSIGAEEAQWRMSRDAGASRRQQRANQGTYKAAVTPAIAEQSLTLPADLAADLDEATAALARLDGRVDALLSADHDLAPLQSVLLRTESASSSQIEGLTVSARGLALATIGESSGTNAEAVVANVRAMDAALALASEPGLSAILVMHEALMRGQDRHTPGSLRVEQVWIGKGAGPLTASFVPPLHERVPSAMDDLEAFMRRVDLPPLAHAALAHAQFETIHPFTDGNGRTGRAIVHAMLRGAGTAQRIALPISAGLLTDLDDYFAALTAYRQGDVRPILTTFARSTRQASEFGGTLVDDLTSARDQMRSSVRVRSDSKVWPAMDLLLGQPVVNVKLLTQRLEVSERTAGTVLKTLEEAGVVTQTSAGRRNRVWQSDPVLTALDEFADRIRRARV